MKYYPIYLDITGKRCVVIGGGDVAERKVKRLLDSGARVVVIGRTLTEGLETLRRDGGIDHIDADYDETYINKDVFLVIGATDSDDVNARICRDGRKRGILVNIVDDPDKCDFILPAFYHQGDLMIAVSTGGKSPALAKKLRQDMEKHFGPEYETLLSIMGKLRKEIVTKGSTPDENRRIFESIINSDILHSIKEKDWVHAKKIIHDITGIDIEVGE